MKRTCLALGLACAWIAVMPALDAQVGDNRSPTKRLRSNDRTRSPTTNPPRVATFPDEFRSIDGSGNNPRRLDLGAAETAFIRLLRADYADGQGAPAGGHRASARLISNTVVRQVADRLNPRGASDFVWQWGQFLDHDVDETPIGAPAVAFDIPVPLADPWFDPLGLGTATISLDRSAFIAVDGVREQVNHLTTFIDASNVYGSDATRAAALRVNDGSGRLLTSAGNLLPYNTAGLPNAPSTIATFFVAGDIRANEQVGLLAMHTLFVREHNFWANLIRTAAPTLDGNTIYELARCAVIAEMQAITVREFLPVLLGDDPLPPYRGYDPRVDPSIANEFATAAYRVGHTMLSPQLLRMGDDGASISAGPLPLANAFFAPEELVATGIDPILRGLAAQQCQAVDVYVIDVVRNFLFGAPGRGGFDLPSLNIQRGRDHGIPPYVVLRNWADGTRVRSFSGVTSDQEVLQRLTAAYADVGDIDAWVGLLAEPPVEGAMVGATLKAIIRDQFVRLRDGDRFWYESYLPEPAVNFFNTQTLATVIRRNTGVGAELPADVFRVR